MKTLLFLFSSLLLFAGAGAQVNIRDKHITNQQERMVFKSWDEDKFTPKPGFLGLNPLYWITWGLHPNYPDTDLRPLGPHGPQSSRMALLVAMSAAEQQYKLQSDSIAQTAIENLATHSSLLSDFDPLWMMYYSSALSPLENPPKNSLSTLGLPELNYLQQSGFISWYEKEHEQLRERLKVARRADMERGSRILYYHRLLLEYRKLQASWEDKKRQSRRFIETKDQRAKLLKRNTPLTREKRSDIEIADQVLKNSKL